MGCHEDDRTEEGSVGSFYGPSRDRFQGQSYGPMFDEKLMVAAAKTKPSWAVISTKDRMLPPAMEKAAAKKMGAVTKTLATCHMSILQEPAKVAEVIDEAARKALTK
jgi:pimeloyl-ACP methyl ester carboxylesterase